jgi:superfamily I DNA and/or RNA helicase
MNDYIIPKLNEANVVFCTLSKAATFDGLVMRTEKGNKLNDNFVYSLIDEASQTLETTSLGAIRECTQKLVLIGDQK